MENTLEVINGRLDIAKEKISEFEDRTIETIQNEVQGKKKKNLKNEQNISELWSNSNR